jgi:GTP-binding protein EngB required for normal cell division
MNKELKELSEAFATLSNSFKELQSDMHTKEPDNKMNDMMNYMHQMVSNIHDRIDRVDNNHWQKMDNHMSASTHLPKLTASQHEKLLKSCGASEDYSVVKPSIYARATRQGNTEFVVDVTNSK